MSDPRFPEGLPWRFAVIDKATFATVTILDRIAYSRTVDLRLNAPASATGSVASDDPEINLTYDDGDPFLEEGTRILYGFRREGGDPPWVPRFAGKILQVEDTGDADRAVSHYTALDPWQELNQRPVRNGDGDLPGAKGLSFTDTDWDVVIGTLLLNTIAEDDTNDGSVLGIDAGTDYGGTSFYSGTIETVDSSGEKFAVIQGSSVGDAWTQIAQLGVCDIVLTPIYDPTNRPGYTHELNIYAPAGQDRHDVIFRHGDNCQLQRLTDGTQRANIIYAYSGRQRALTFDSPHVDAASVAKYGPQVAQLFYPGQNKSGAVDALAAFQLFLRAAGRTTIQITPTPERAGRPLTDYGLGDRVPVWADRGFRKPIVGNDPANYFRIYGIPIDIGDDALERVTGLVAIAQ